MSIGRVADKALERALEVELGHADVLGEDGQRRGRAAIADAVVDYDLGLLHSEHLAHLRRGRKAVGQAAAASAIAEKLGFGRSVGVDSVGAQGPARGACRAAVDACRSDTVHKRSIGSGVPSKHRLPLVVVTQGGGR